MCTFSLPENVPLSVYIAGVYLVAKAKNVYFSV